MRYIPGAAMAVLLMTAGTASAQVHQPSAAEEAVIVNYRAAMNKIVDGLVPATGGWQEDQPNHFDIGDNPDIIGDNHGPFTFDGSIAREYKIEAQADDLSAKMTALTQELYLPSTTPARRKAIIAEITRLSQAPQTPAEPQQLLIITEHNMQNMVPDGDSPEPVDITLPGVARVFREPAHQLSSGSAYVLEFGDPSRFHRVDDYLRYDYLHNDGTPHIENIEIELQGPQDVIDAILKTYDWTKVQAILNP